MDIREQLASLFINETNADDQQSNQANETNEVEDSVAKKSLEPSFDSLDLTLSIGTCSTDQSNDQIEHEISKNDNVAHPLFPAIGRDSSISCILRCSRANYGSIACVNRNFRSLINGGEIYKLRRRFGIVEHWVYYSCQPLEWEAFDPMRRHWMSVPKMEHNPCFVNADKESLAVGTEILVFGRDFMSHVIYRYSLLTNTWTTAQPMNQQRYVFGCASFDAKAIVAGGCDSQGNILSSAELYDSETQTWTKLKDMNNPRKKCSGVFMDNKFYVIGGTGGPYYTHLTSGEEYDFETQTWNEIPDMIPARTEGEAFFPEAAPLIAVVNNELFVAHYVDMMVRKYNKNTKTWSNVGRLPDRLDSMFGWGLAFRACGDRLIMINGTRHGGWGFIEINSWVPNDYPVQWELIGRKQSPSFVYNCAVMGC